MAKHQQTVSAGSRLYYIDLREDSKDNEYVTITEMNTRTKKRSCIYIHTEHLGKIMQALNVTNANVSKR